MRCRSFISPRLKTKPVSSMTSQFSGTSLASTHTPAAHSVEQGEGQSFKVGRQHEQRCVGEDFFQSISRKPIEEFNLITFVLAKVCHVFLGVARPACQHQLYRGLRLLKGVNQKITILFRRESSQSVSRIWLRSGNSPIIA